MDQEDMSAFYPLPPDERSVVLESKGRSIDPNQDGHRIDALYYDGADSPGGGGT
jgi:hypothetical protein